MGESKGHHCPIGYVITRIQEFLRYLILSMRVGPSRQVFP